MVQEQNIRDGTAVQTVSSDILLLANTKTKSIRVASDEAGKTDRFDKINLETPPFLQINAINNVENFVSNYFRQGKDKDPTDFRLFRAPIADVKEAAPFLRELFKENPSKEIQDFVRRYEVKQVSNNVNNQVSKNESINHLKQNKMSTIEETKTMTAPAANASQYRYNEALINWEQLKQCGLSRDYLEKRGLLDGMLKGYKTNELVPVRLNFGSAALATDARLSFRQAPDGQVALMMHGMRREPELNKPYFGHIFSDEDRKNLKETGNMGRTAMMLPQGGNEKIPYIISVDRLTNEVVGFPAEKAYIPDAVSGVKLSDYEKEQLREGKAIFVEGMTSKKGEDFNAHLQLNADRRGVEYIFPKDGQFNRESIGGVELTKKQLEDFNSGKAIFLEDMKKRNGETFSSFIKLDCNGNTQYTRYNPDSPEGAREIYIPKEICGAHLTHEDKETLRTGKPIFLYDMVNRKGEEFSSFVKIDTETGAIQYARTEDGFNEKPAYKVPHEVWGVALNTKERADLQDGRAIHIADMTGVNGQKFSSWMKVNERMGQLVFYPENPDKPRQSAGQSESVPAARQESKQQSDRDTKKQEKETKKPASRRKIS